MACFNFNLNLTLGNKKPKIVNDKVNYILSHIHTSMYQYKDRKDVKVNSEILQKILGKDYNKYVNLLISGGYITTDYKYSVGSSRVYSLTDKVNKKGIKKYDNKYYNKSIHILTSQLDSRLSKKDLYLRDKLIEWRNLDRIKFDDNSKVLKKIKKLREENYDAYYSQLYLYEKITDKSQFTFTTDKNGNRIYTNFSNLKKDLRSNIRIDGENIVELDIKNSQFQFLSLYLNTKFGLKTKDTMDFYDKCHKGILYDDMVKSIRIRKKDNTFFDRDDFKRLALNWLYAENIQSLSNNEKSKLYFINQYFKIKYPTIHNWITQLKSTKDGGKLLSHQLQKVEADLMIKKIQYELALKNIACLSTHDSIYVSKSNIKELERIKEELWIEGIGLVEIKEYKENKESKESKENKSVGVKRKLDIYVEYNKTIDKVINTKINDKKSIQYKDKELSREKEKKLNDIFNNYNEYIENYKKLY
jgi:hypothetical protein